MTRKTYKLIIIAILVILLLSLMVINVTAEEPEYPTIIIEVIDEDEETDEIKDMFIQLIKTMTESAKDDNNETLPMTAMIDIEEFEIMLEELREMKQEEIDIITLLFSAVIGTLCAVAFITAWRG